MRRVLIVSQFAGYSPYWLQNAKVAFGYLSTHVMDTQPGKAFRAPEMKTVEEDFQPDWCTTVIAADENGNAYAWKYNHDSSD